MNCIDVASNLQSFMDDELPYASMDSIRSHLGNCPMCGEKFEAEKLFRQTLKDKINWRPATDTLLNDVKYRVQNTVI